LKSIDVGVWFSEREDYNYCAQWDIDRSVSNSVKGEFWLTSKKDDVGNRFNISKEFLNSLQEVAKPVEDLMGQAINEKEKYDESLFNFSQPVVDNWQKYVAPSERKKILKPFLEPVLKYYFGRDYENRKLTMLDTSSGIGCDAVALEELSPESEIFFNESSLGLNRKAENWLKNESGTGSAKKVKVTSTPWELLNVRYSKGYFDVILLLGNFISRGKNLDVIREYLKKFRSLLKPNGVLVIDHRNYNRIRANLDAKETYFEDFVKLLKTNSGLYRGFGEGEGIYTWPIDIDGTKKTMTFRFGENKSAEPLNEQKDIVLTMFSNADFYEIVKEVFDGCEIDRCFDYKPPNLWDKIKYDGSDFLAAENSNFIIYIIGNTTRPPQ